MDPHHGSSGAPRAPAPRVTVRTTPTTPAGKTPAARAATPSGAATAAPRTNPPLPAPTKDSYWNFDRLLVTIGTLVLLVSPGLFFGFFVYMFLAPQLVPTLLALGFVLWKTRPWAYLTAAILGAVFPLMTIVMFGILGGGLSNPVDNASYAVLSFIVLGFVFLEIGAISGFVHGRKKRMPMPPMAGWKTTRGVAALLTVAIVAGMVLTGALAANKVGDTYGYDIRPEAQMSMVTKEFEFGPKDPTVQAGVLTEIIIKNEDKEFHTFTYIANGTVYNHDIYGGKSARFLVLFATPGTIPFWCDPHSDGAGDDDEDSMIGVLTVA